MSKLADYLQEHLMGEVVESREIRAQLSYDASILHVTPALAVYPKNELDVRKTTRFCWQLAERGKLLPITARGGGSDTSGASIGKGIIMLTTAHMNRLLELETKKKTVTVEPGITYDKLQQALYTHGLFLPAYPASSTYATIGGGLANNSLGEKSAKYGTIAKFTQSLKVVLANGEIIETGTLNKRELSRKMGLSTFEGNIYRALDALLEDNWHLIEKLPPMGGAGYNLSGVKHGDNFDLTPLFIGSQGTLGIITEATFKLETHNPEVALAALSFETYEDFADSLPGVLALKPSMVEVVSQAAFQAVGRHSPKRLKDSPLPKDCVLHLLVEFDNARESSRKDKIKDLSKLATKNDAYMVAANGPEDQQKLTNVIRSVNSLFMLPDGPQKTIPLADSLLLPPANLAGFLKETDAMFRSIGLLVPMWGHAAHSVVKFHPQIDLAQVGDRQRLFKLADLLRDLTIKHGGNLNASGEGRVRAPHIHRIYGNDYLQLIKQVKSIFDPHGILNPGVKTATNEEIVAMMRDSYSLAHRHEHLPR